MNTNRKSQADFDRLLTTNPAKLALVGEVAVDDIHEMPARAGRFSRLLAIETCFIDHGVEKCTFHSLMMFFYSVFPYEPERVQLKSNQCFKNRDRQGAALEAAKANPAVLPDQYFHTNLSTRKPIEINTFRTATARERQSEQQKQRSAIRDANHRRNHPFNRVWRLDLRELPKSARAAWRDADRGRNHPFNRAWRLDLRELPKSARAAGRDANHGRNHPFNRASRLDLRELLKGSIDERPHQGHGTRDYDRRRHISHPGIAAANGALRVNARGDQVRVDQVWGDRARGDQARGKQDLAIKLKERGSVLTASNQTNNPTQAADRNAAGGAVFTVLVTISFCHLLNDVVQSLLPAIYPIIKATYHLDFGQIGLITLANQLTASLLQPFVGHAMDRRPAPYSLVWGMVSLLSGLLVLAFAPHYWWVLVAAGLVGIGSAIFHPESSRVARMASGGRHGLAQSLFQVGGNAGQALGPLMAGFIAIQRNLAWFALVPLAGMVMQFRIGGWYKARLVNRGHAHDRHVNPHHGLPSARIRLSIAVLLALMFSKFFYLASIGSYYEFYLVGKFGLSLHHAQECLFVFLASVAAGTVIGGPIGDRIGRKLVIWCSILGVLPFSLMLPHASLLWTIVLSVPIGVILASAFPAIIVYAQELLPGRVGLVSGLFFGFAFGMGGIGAAVLGQLADRTSIGFVYQVCAFLPAIGLLTALLPNLDRRKVLS